MTVDLGYFIPKTFLAVDGKHLPVLAYSMTLLPEYYESMVRFEKIWGLLQSDDMQTVDKYSEKCSYVQKCHVRDWSTCLLFKFSTFL